MHNLKVPSCGPKLVTAPTQTSSASICSATQSLITAASISSSGSPAANSWMTSAAAASHAVQSSDQ